MSTKPTRIAILATGNELMDGSVLNTNTQYIAAALSQIGLTPYEQVTVSDHPDQLLRAFQRLLENYDLVIAIGGLGPTVDDRTRDLAAQALNLDLQFCASTWDTIQAIAARNYPDLVLTENNKTQAMILPQSLALANANGTAPGLVWPAPNNKPRLILLPGPPRECLPMFDQQVLPLLRQAFSAHDAPIKSFYLWGPVKLN